MFNTAWIVADADAVMDSGVENLNGTVDELFDSSALRRVIAQIDVSFSSSPIEAWGRRLKHQWPYLHSLDDLDLGSAGCSCVTAS